MSRELLRPSLAGALTLLPSSDSEAAEQLELSSEDDHAAADDNVGSPRSVQPEDVAATSSPSTGADDADAEEEADAGETQQAAAAGSSDPSGSRSLDDGVSYASLLWDNTRAVIEQADESRHSMKRMLTFLQGKADLDRSYAKSLRKLVEKAAPDEKQQTQLAAAAAANSSSSGSPRPNSSPTSKPTPAAVSSSSSSFELCLSSFRHLSLTLCANVDLLAAKVEEQLMRPFGQQQQRHQRETRRVADEIARLNKQLQSLQDGLQHSKASAKKACLELQLWLMEQRERAGRGGAGGASQAALDGLPGFGGGVDSHTVFDELVSSFRWDADSMKKRALSIDSRYVQAVKALRSFRPEYDRLLRQLMTDAQREEEERRKEQLRVVSAYCELHTAMYDKYQRSLRSVAAMSAQVNSRREMRRWMREHRGDGRQEPLPEYVMHKGHPRYDETQEVEEQHEHGGLTDDDSDAAAGDENEEDEDEEKEAEDEPEEEDDEDDERESSLQGRRRRRRARVAHRKGGDELDEREDEKTEERIVAEKVLRVFINKVIGNRQTAAEQERDGDEQTAAAAAMDLSSPTSPTLTSPLPRTAFMPVRAEQLGDGSALDDDEEQAAKAIFSTRDGRNAFAACFSFLSPTCYSSQLPLSLFSTFSQPSSPSAASRTAAAPSPPAASLTLSAASFAALSSLTVLFLDSTVGSNHVEPAVFVANVAHQILKARDAQQLHSGSQPAAAGSTSSAAADDVMRKEQLEGGEEAEPPVTLLSHLSSHPLFADTQRFFSSALFASLHHHFAQQSLYIHRWHSDAEQEAVMRGRRRVTLRLLRDYSQLMRHCGVKRKERRRFVEKQIRVFDLLAAEEEKEEVATLRKLNERLRPAAAGRPQDAADESEDESGSPMAIRGLRELDSDVDSEEERKRELLLRKEQERRLMSDEKKRRRRVRVNEHGAYEQTAAAARQDEQKARKKEEEQREQERRRAEEEERSRGKKTGFFASLFGRTSPSPSPTPSLPPEHQRSAAGQAVAAPAVAVKGETATGSSGVRIPIPVAAAVPPPVAAAAASRKPELAASAGSKSATAAAAASPVGKKQTATGTAAPASASVAAADGATKRARVVKKRAARKPAAAAAAAASPQQQKAAEDAAVEERKVASAEPSAQSSAASALQQSADLVQTATSTDDMP